MADGFAELIDRANGFFTELAANNRRAWFEERKDFYKSEIQQPGQLLADLMAEELSRMTGTAHRAKLFRIYRDVRFSKDKSPYNPHLHISWLPTDGEYLSPQWFFGSAPDYLVLCTGLPGLQGDALTRWRAFVDAEGDEIASTMAEAETSIGARLSAWGASPLKRVPKPYAADHPHGDLLKRKSLILEATPADGWREKGLIPALRDTATGLLPIWKLCTRV